VFFFHFFNRLFVAIWQQMMVTNCFANATYIFIYFFLHIFPFKNGDIQTF